METQPYGWSTFLAETILQYSQSFWMHNELKRFYNILPYFAVRQTLLLLTVLRLVVAAKHQSISKYCHSNKNKGLSRFF